MILDIITAALIVIPMGIGMWRGFLYILVRLLGWVGSLAAGFFAAPYVKGFLAQTIVGDRIHDMLSDQFTGAADGVTDLYWRMVKPVNFDPLILILVIRPLTKNRKGKIMLPNKIGGLIVGAAEGLLLAFMFLAALIPVMHMSSPDTASAIAESLRFSYLAGNLYDGNLLLAVF